MIHPTTNLWGGVVIGKETKIGAFCDIGGWVGKDCKIQCHVSIPPGWTIGDRVFIGPKATLCNDRHPSASNGHFTPSEGYIEDDVVIGAGAIILPVRIGKGAFIGAGAVVTKDVPAGETWVGNPARPI